jgi:predicted O-methyltransferase YrrM
MQIKGELTAFLGLVSEEPPCSVIEIGTANGGSLFMLARAAASDARIVSIDMPGGEFGGGYREMAIRMIRASRVARQEIRLISGDSHDPVTVAAVKEFAAPADLLFIDGDHTLDGVAADFANYAPLVRSGGLVAFHDIVPGPTAYVGEVPRYWADVKHGRRHTEFVEDWRQGGYGIGVLHI